MSGNAGEINMGIAADSTRRDVARDVVLVVHGFAGKRLWMTPLCARLRSRSYRVENWSYASAIGSLERHARRLREHLTGPLADAARIHIVAHSMGSIVVRAALARGPLSNLGRVVLFAPPNSGTPVARVATALLGGRYPPLADLSDRPGSFVNRLPALGEIPIAVVAARFDLLVPTANTHLAGEREHVVLNATHNSLLLSRQAANLACAFLETGRFDSSDCKRRMPRA